MFCPLLYSRMFKRESDLCAMLCVVVNMDLFSYGPTLYFTPLVLSLLYTCIIMNTCDMPLTISDIGKQRVN